MFNIIGRRYLYFLLSTLLILPGLVAWAIWGLRLGIDFTGGSLLELSIAQTPPPAQVKEVLAGQGFPEAAVTTTNEGTYLVRARDMADEQRRTVVQEVGNRFGPVREVQFASVGPTIGAELTRKAVLAVLAAAGLILLYLWWAFRQVPQAYRYGTCAVLALLHDVLLVLGMWAILGRLVGMEVDALFVTALLTIVGFSVHDTIVVFDRIRENLVRFRGEPFEKVVNFSVNQTLDRSLNTSLTVLFTLAALLLLGGVTIRPFVLTLLICVTTGTYSSIFNASCLLVVWENGEVGQLWRRLTGRGAPARAAA